MYEKGFIQLLNELPELIEYAKNKGLDFHLKVFCREYDRATKKEKKLGYIKELDSLIKQLNLQDYVSILDKVSINKLRESIKDSSGLIVPSLYDPYCLMPHYAIFENKISFVSVHTGISENIKSSDYLFNPMSKGSLLKAIKLWMEKQGDFHLNNTNESFRKLYLD